jgi:DNA modification methylase
MVAVFREVRRVLRDDGTVWCNLGDSFGDGKQLQGIPWKVAFALQDDGWILRMDVIWAKGLSFCPSYSGSVMPESVTDRPTKAHEYLFLLTKSPRYYYDADAVREVSSPNTHRRAAVGGEVSLTFKMGEVGSGNRSNPSFQAAMKDLPPGSGRNLRSVWAINPESFSGVHFATFPQALVTPCIKAGTSQKGCCAACGAPWERLVEQNVAPYGPLTPKQSAGLVMGANVRQSRGPGWRERPQSNSQTTGWSPSCECQAVFCPQCCVVIEYINNEEPITTQRRREEGVPVVQGQISRTDAAESVVQSGMRGSLLGEAQEDHDGPNSHDEGLRDAVSAGTPVEKEGRIRDGASRCHGEVAGALFDTGRSSPPPERQKSRQPSEQFEADVEESSRPRDTSQPANPSNVPALPDRVLSQRKCQTCGSHLVLRLPEVQPSVVCDPFCGSGTAGIVALRLGRKFIGIDLSEEYCRMARNRIVGPLFAEETA